MLKMNHALKAMNVVLSDVIVLYDKKKERFLYVPKQYVIDEYLKQPYMIMFLTLQDIPFIEIREKFIQTLSGNMKKDFEKSFKGQQRMKNFRDCLKKYHQYDEFNLYEKDYYKRLIKTWCKHNQIECREI